MKENIYIIGFPKSGNTWLIRLIAEALNSNISLRKKDILHKVENSTKRNGNYLLHKIHYTQKIQKVKESKRIYIIRDPRATFVSGFFNNYNFITEEQVKKNPIIKKFFYHEVLGISHVWRGDVVSRTKRLIYLILKSICFSPKREHVGNWSDHVEFWTSIPNTIIVRYEDLLDNTESELKRIFKELEININDEKIKKTVLNQSFSNKKKQFLANGDLKNAKFMRSGKKNGWESLLDESVIRKINKTHEKVLTKYGYLKEKK